MANYQARNTSWCSLSSLVEKMNYLESSLGNLVRGEGGWVVPCGRFISRNESVT